MEDQDFDVNEVINLQMFDINSDDQLERERGRCLAESCDARPAFNELRDCTARVQKKIKYTAETCVQELNDLMEALDECVKHRAFNRLA